MRAAVDGAPFARASKRRRRGGLANAELVPMPLSPSGRAACALLVLFSLPAAPATAAGSHRERHVAAYHVKSFVTLSAYGDPRPAAFEASGLIAGDGLVAGLRHCLLAEGASITDITPAGVDECAVAAMKAGTVVGHVVQNGASHGFIYRDGRGYVVADAVAFTAINASSRALGVKKDGSTGVYDAPAGAWSTFADAGRGCTMTAPLALNDRFVFGGETCTDGHGTYALAASGRYGSIALPAGLSPTRIFTSSDQLVLVDQRSGGHAYLWSVSGLRAPLDLGSAPGDLYGTYTPAAANGRGVVVGANDPLFFAWVRTPADGVRDLDALIAPRTFFSIDAVDVDESDEILAQAFDFTTGSQVWMILQAG
jgi:hypothetical protein